MFLTDHTLIATYLHTYVASSFVQIDLTIAAILCTISY